MSEKSEDWAMAWMGTYGAQAARVTIRAEVQVRVRVRVMDRV